MSTTDYRFLTKAEKLYPSKQQFPLLPFTLKRVPSSRVPRFTFPLCAIKPTLQTLLGLLLILAVRFSRFLGDLHLHLFVKMRELQNYFLGTISFSLFKKNRSSGTSSTSLEKHKRLLVIYCLKSSLKKSIHCPSYTRKV